HGNPGTRDTRTPPSSARFAVEPFVPAQWFTLGVIGVWIVAVIAFGAHVGMAAFAGAVLLVMARVGDEVAAFRRIPWGVILMVCGVTVLIALLDRTGGMDLFTSLLAAIASPATV